MTFLPGITSCSHIGEVNESLSTVLYLFFTQQLNTALNVLCCSSAHKSEVFVQNHWTSRRIWKPIADYNVSWFYSLHARFLNETNGQRNFLRLLNAACVLIFRTFSSDDFTIATYSLTVISVVCFVLLFISITGATFYFIYACPLKLWTSLVTFFVTIRL